MTAWSAVWTSCLNTSLRMVASRFWASGGVGGAGDVTREGEWVCGILLPPLLLIF